MMPKAGRLALVRSVLVAIPLHQLMVLSFNKKFPKQVEKILRGFLWVGTVAAKGGHCHVNHRTKVCGQFRGFVIPDLAPIAINRQFHWLWRKRTDPLRPWRGLDMQFTRDERQVFHASTKMVLRDGTSALSWEDQWLDAKALGEVVPDLLALIPRRPRKHHTVHEALIERRWMQLCIRLRNIQLTVEPDALVWWWMPDFQYSKSCYNTLFQGSIVPRSWKLNWKLWATPT